LAACTGHPAELNNSANQHLREGRHEDAIYLYSAAVVAAPDEARLYLNTAAAYEMAGDTAQAAAALQQAALRGDAPTRAVALYNLGNLYFNSGSMEQAIDAYRQALLADNTLEDARHNLEIALAFRVLPTPTPIEMQTNPELAQINPTAQPSPNPADSELPTPSPTPEDLSGPTPSIGGERGETAGDRRVTPVPNDTGELNVENAMRILIETQFDQDNIGFRAPAPIDMTPASRKDW
jgi:tetratricopeptide (TPR) repeat protein